MMPFSNFNKEFFQFMVRSFHLLGTIKRFFLSSIHKNNPLNSLSCRKDRIGSQRFRIFCHVEQFEDLSL
ncbi:unnamed protein product [Rhizophagus irregularis]|nr:unnamed protein product [Rhizophagus irregularis]